MTYRFAIWRLLFSLWNLLLARAAVKASSWNGFGCGWDVGPLQVPCYALSAIVHNIRYVLHPH